MLRSPLGAVIVHAVEQVERFEPQLQLRSPAIGTCLLSAKSTLQKFGPRTLLRGRVPERLARVGRNRRRTRD